MLDVLWLRFDAPLMSFGAPIVDNFGVVQPFPGLAMLCGLLGNALGYDHRDADALEALQRRLRFAARCDRAGQRLRDFQTVALGQDFLLANRGWTTRGRLEGRAGAGGERTHIRYRDYWADAVHTVVVTLDPIDTPPSLDAIEAALRKPARPLFIGRKTCLPAAPILLGRGRAPDLRAALEQIPGIGARSDDPRQLPGWWPLQDAVAETPVGTRRVPVTDTRDWRNQIHVGERIMLHGMIALSPSAGGADE